MITAVGLWTKTNRRARVLLGAATAVLVLLAAACGGGTEAEAPAAESDPIHAHGLGLNPADGALYIATHTGLFRMESGSDEAARVGDRRQDTMGFTVAGADRFLGSGHPDLREGLPPLLGLVESLDRGRSWEPISLLGKADFHALRATGSFIHGYDASGGRLMISDDGGQTWRVRRPPPLMDLVVDPDDPSRIVAASEGGLIVSRNDGRSWRPLGGQPGLLAWPRRDALYALSLDGELSVSGDGGASWARAGRVGGRPEAMTAPTSERLIVALEHGALRSSSDGGRTWTDGAWPL
ncbi:F510_1955 family glycosylhydrolase [Miltoncostaea marina]|uniref:F510_1955 family glycosylhydrolase n=1 Tax=Miltoncostaea marina TaxID=2843215 RepID=UPI001C3DF4A1|nr:sialidase family protein [Miltoncostaea marina]